jgi:predicted DNA-binding transcriptional regulator YafY
MSSLHSIINIRLKKDGRTNIFHFPAACHSQIRERVLTNFSRLKKERLFVYNKQNKSSGVIGMGDILMHAAGTGQKLEMVYISESRRISQRVIKVLAVTDTMVMAYCYLKKHYRSFKKDNILAVFPADNKMRLNKHA